MVSANSRMIDGKKFLWDGEVYDSAQAAETRKRDYESQGFEVRLVEEDGQLLLYTRRVVKEVVLAGTPPHG